MKLRAVAVMCAWVFLFGCEDDDKKTATKNINGQDVTFTVDEPGCDADVQTGTIETPEKKGKIKIEWELAALLTITGALALTLLAGRRE